eukprot:maker-scaffold343_size201629-snap-gene-1.15 protein:Tk08442 transcript:maker-scaffold343_size201629-snap-gene-1.15-mRNA-1 annotation:"membrane protein"
MEHCFPTKLYCENGCHQPLILCRLIKVSFLEMRVDTIYVMSIPSPKRLPSVLRIRTHLPRLFQFSSDLDAESLGFTLLHFLDNYQPEKLVNTSSSSISSWREFSCLGVILDLEVIRNHNSHGRL